jgi:hypothetical protein
VCSLTIDAAQRTGGSLLLLPALELALDNLEVDDLLDGDMTDDKDELPELKRAD